MLYLRVGSEQAPDCIPMSSKAMSLFHPSPLTPSNTTWEYNMHILSVNTILIVEAPTILAPRPPDRHPILTLDLVSSTQVDFHSGRCTFLIL